MSSEFLNTFAWLYFIIIELSSPRCVNHYSIMFKRILNQLRIIWDFKDPEVALTADDDNVDVEKGTDEINFNLNDDSSIV